MNRNRLAHIILAFSLDTMQCANHCTRVAPISTGRQPCLVAGVVRHRTRPASHARSSDAPVASVPQQVSSTLQHRQSKVAALASKLQTAEPTQNDVKQVLQEFQYLSEQVQQLAQHMAEVDTKAEAKLAEKALKKERKAAEKALKKKGRKLRRQPRKWARSRS